MAREAPAPGFCVTTLPTGTDGASTGSVIVFRPAAWSFEAAAAAARFWTDGIPPPPGLCRKRLTGLPCATDWFAGGTSQPVARVIAFGSDADGCTGPTVSLAFFSAAWATPSGLPQTSGTGTCLAATPTTTATALPGLSLKPGPGFWLMILPTSFRAATILVAAGLFVSRRPRCSSSSCTFDAAWPLRLGTVIVGGFCRSL